MAEAIERFMDGQEMKRGVELSVVSVEGFATTDEEWEEVGHWDKLMGEMVKEEYVGCE